MPNQLRSTNQHSSAVVPIWRNVMRLISLLCVSSVLVYQLLRPLPALRAQSEVTRWEPPVVLFDAGQAARVFNPLVFEDTEGRIKILWEVVTETDMEPGSWSNGIYCVDGDGSYWSQPIDVIVDPDGGQTFWPQHALDAYGRLHLVWIGANSNLFYSQVPSADSCDARSWATVELPITDQVLHADIAVDNQDNLHVAFAARDEDIYHTLSTDDGLSWSDPVRVSSVGPSVTSAFPSLAVDTSGRIHVAWEEIEPSNASPSLGLYYSSSPDGGQMWSSQTKFSQAEGEYTQPSIVALQDGSVHLLWNGRISTRGRYQQWSTDGGMSWSAITEFIPKSMGGGQTGPPNAATDSAGTLHVVTGTDDTTAIAWTGQRWLAPQDIGAYETFGNMEDQNIGVALGNRLHVVANAGLQEIVLMRGTTAAAEVATEFKVLPTQPTKQVTATPTAAVTPESTRMLSAEALMPDSPSSRQTGSSFSLLMFSSGLVFLFMLVVIAIVVRRRHL